VKFGKKASASSALPVTGWRSKLFHSWTSKTMELTTTFNVNVSAFSV